MNTKTCLNCGESFTSKRSDAICCSNNCRSNYNYKKAQRKKSNLSLPTASGDPQVQENNVVIKGELDIQFLLTKHKECESKIELILEDMVQVENLKIELTTQKSELEKQIVTIEAGEKAKLVKLYNLSDLTLYNNYLNRAYLDEHKKGNEFAHTRLKSESELKSTYNPTLRISIENYRSNIATAINKHDLETARLKHNITTIESNLIQYNEKIKELQNQLRFYEARILKYEALLLTV